ncbi:MAG: uncharacterized protein H6Q90_4838, partial [Deltaproteobacteria bacterium]|nr:uncharacterized protein [Deltaproteobacteria bacterium]
VSMRGYLPVEREVEIRTNALQHFLASNRLVPNGNVQFNIARAYEQLGRFADAYRYYVDVSRGDPDGKLKSDVAAALARITPKVAVIAVETSPPGAILYLDRKDLGSVGTTPAQLGLKPGTYTVVVELPGYEPAQRDKISASIGATERVQIELVRIVGGAELSGPPGTAVRIDDERGPVRCQLPCSLQLAPGAHIAYFERPGFTVVPQAFTITAKQTVKVEASSVAVVGSLLVSADEPDALIEVDGRALGFTPAVIPNIPIGKRRVRVSMRGYLPVEREVEIRTNAQTELRDLVLPPERTVTAASREAESIEDAPASVSVISSQELEAFAYPSILEALRGVRGFAVNFDSVYGSAAVRGLGQASDFSNRLLVLSDGAVLNEDILYQPFIHYDGRVDLGDVQRIEIVRGPTSVLYGTGAVSGVVNLVLKDRDEPQGMHAQISSYDNSTSRARAGFVQRFGKHAGMWASVAGGTSQGRNEALTFDAGDGQGAAQHVTPGFDKFNAYTLTSKAWWNGFTLQGFLTSRDQTIPTGNYSSRFADLRNKATDSRLLIEGKYKHALRGGHELLVRAHGNHAGYQLALFYDLDPDNPGSGTQNSYEYLEKYQSWWGGAEARLTLALHKTLKLTVGTDAVVHTRATMEGGSFDVDGTMFESSLSTNTPYQVFAGSTLLDWRPHRALRVQAGLRFDYWNLRGDQRVAPGEDRGARSFQAASPRIAVITKPTDQDVAKLMFGSAFRAPSAYELFYNDGGLTSAVSSACGETLEPERIYALELEETHRFNLDWSGLAAAHATIARNIIETIPIGDACAATSGFDPSVLYSRNSDVSQRIYGIDVELRREFRAGVMASAQYGYVHGRYAEPPLDDNGTALGRRLPNAPTHYAGAKVIIPIVRSSLNGAFRAALEDRRQVDIGGIERSDRAVVADMVASGLIGRVGLRYAIGVYNLFNWRYALPALPFSTELMPQNGRSFMFSLTLQR